MKIIQIIELMKPNPETELEARVHAELRQLPDRRAPAGLMPRVLEAIEARRRQPWWTKSWAYWPWPPRCLFLAVTGSVFALLVYLTLGIAQGVSLPALAAEARGLIGGFAVIGSFVHALGGAIVLVLRPVASWLLWGALAVGAACYLTTVWLGTVCYRLAARRI